MHIASAVGTPVVLLLDKRAPESYLPQGDRHRVIYNSVIGDITVDEVYEATQIDPRVWPDRCTLRQLSPS